MFFQKIPKSIISFCNYFLKLNFGLFLAQNISMNARGFLEGHVPPLFLAWQEFIPGIS